MRTRRCPSLLAKLAAAEAIDRGIGFSAGLRPGLTANARSPNPGGIALSLAEHVLSGDARSRRPLPHAPLPEAVGHLLVDRRTGHLQREHDLPAVV